MAHLQIKGFVLREQPYGESNRILNILTADRGLITVAARGARRRNSPSLASTQIFAFAEFVLFEHRDRLSVDSAQLIESFQGLHQDIHQLVCAAHLAEVFIDLLKDDLPHRPAYELWAHAINQLHLGKDVLLVVHIAQLRLLAQSGFKPPLEKCYLCQNNLETPSYFAYIRPAAYCHKHGVQGEANHERLLLTGGSLACLHYILSAPVDKIFALRISEQVRQEIISFSSNWLHFQMEKKYKKLDMLKDLE